MTRIKSLLLLSAFCLLCSCQSAWKSPDAWYVSDTIDGSYVDVFYLVSTNILESHDSRGRVSPTAVLNQQEKDVLREEIAYMRNQVFSDSLNYFAPFYHQATLSALLDSSPEEYAETMSVVEDEAWEAFRYYLDNYAGDRRFILAGFSQGAMLVKSILKRMDASELSRMVAAYVIGDELTEEDLLCPNIIPASGRTDTGVTVSFNSVCDVDAVWSAVCSAPVACINPVNWCTDATPAPLFDRGASLSVALDTLRNVVVVTGYGDNPPKSAFDEPWPKGNLHGQEIIIYASSIGQNARDRAYQ